MNRLEPAISYQMRIIEEFEKRYYTDDLFYYWGEVGSYLPDIPEDTTDGMYAWAIHGKYSRTIGYISCHIDWRTRSVDDLAMISFNKGNPDFGLGVRDAINKLIDEYKMRRIEWRCIQGNPAKKHYDRWCAKYNGNVYTLHDSVMDYQGNYRNEYIYEILLQH